MPMVLGIIEKEKHLVKSNNKKAQIVTKRTQFVFPIDPSFLNKNNRLTSFLTSPLKGKVFSVAHP
jgi:hypothetical protein